VRFEVISALNIKNNSAVPRNGDFTFIRNVCKFVHVVFQNKILPVSVSGHQCLLITSYFEIAALSSDLRLSQLSLLKAKFYGMCRRAVG
jgi:hypothetical protein